jgi:hypothetical protein
VPEKPLPAWGHSELHDYALGRAVGDWINARDRHCVIVAVLASNGSSRSGTELPKYTLDFWAGACLGDLSMKQGGIEHYRRCMRPAQAGVLMVELHVERTIDASPERTFDWLTDPANLTTAPLFLRAGWAKGFSGPQRGRDTGSHRSRSVAPRRDHGL